MLSDPVLAALEELGERLPGRRGIQAAESLSGRYRAVDQGAHGIGAVGSADDALAYAVSRMPATYAAARSALSALSSGTTFEPHSVVDLGGGLGAAGYAAASTWPSVEEVQVVDAEPLMLAAGRELQALVGESAPRMTWARHELVGSPAEAASADLVTIAYVLSELPVGARRRVVQTACAASQAAVVVVEPGTPHGYERVMEARSAIIEAGFEVAAPCPHDLACPLLGGGDWCHFSVRLARTRSHREAKGGRLGYEDEKFSYVAGIRDVGDRGGHARIIRHPTWRKSLVELRLCQPGEPAVTDNRIPRSAGDLYRAARHASWGETWPPPPR